MSDATLINTNLGGSSVGLPIGCLSLVAVLEEQGYSVDFKDYQVSKVGEKPSPETFCHFIRDTNPVLGLSVICNSLPTVLGGIQKLKEEKPDKLVILGGPSATDTPSEILENFPVDIIVIGEGELTIVDLMKALDGEKDLREVPGIAYRENGRIIINPRRERIKDLDSLPFPAYHKIDFEDYGSAATLITSRGCPYRCGFCSAHSIWEHKMTYRSIDNVVEEIGQVMNAVKRIVFTDDILLVDKKRTEKLCERFQKEGIDVPWRCNGRVNYMTDSILSKMVSSGCEEIFLGIESGSDRVLKTVYKEFTVEQAAEAIKKVSIHVPRVATSYIWGYPFETLEDFYETILLLISDSRQPNISTSISLLSPLPLTEIYREHKQMLDFSCEYQSGAVKLGENEDISSHRSLIEIIKSFPSIFSAFYYFKHDYIQKKREVIEKLGRDKILSRGPVA